MKTIELALICDDLYVMPTAVTITSIIKNHSSMEKLSFHIFSTSLSDESKNALTKMRNKKVSIKIHEIEVEDTGRSADQKTNLSATNISLVKFDFDRYLPRVQKLLYLDSDLIVRCDVSELYNISLDGKVIAAVSNLYDRRHCEKLGLNQSQYFNTGVMLMDLDAFRKSGYSFKLHEYKRIGYNAFMDQDSFNFVFKGMVLYLPFSYNVRLDSLLFQDFQIGFKDYYGLSDDYNSGKAVEEAKILHYCTKYKPWKYRLPILSDYFEQYYYESPFAGESLNLEVYKFGMGFRTILLKMPISKPIISVFVDCNNSDDYLIKRCVDSFICQTNNSVEVICFGNVEKNVDGAHFIILKSDDRIPELLKHSKGDYVLFISAHDYFYQDGCAYLIDVIKDNPSCDSFVFNYRTFDDKFKKFVNNQIYRFGKSTIVSKGAKITYGVFKSSSVDCLGQIKLCSVGGTVLFRKNYFNYECKHFDIKDWRSSTYLSLSKSNRVAFVNAVLCNVADGYYNKYRYIRVDNNPMKKTKISVILPAHCISPYLDECFASLVNQSFTDYEIIVVDDSSTDDTLSRLKEYSTKYSFFHVFSLAVNCGPGISRNIGMNYASGDYYLLLDSDDYFDLNMLEEMYSCACSTDSEVVICKSEEFDDQTRERYVVPSMYRTELLKGNNNVYLPTDNSKYIFNVFNGWAWDKLICSKLLKRNNLSFLELYRNEDMVVSYMALVCCNHFSYLDYPYVHHRRNIKNSAEKSGVSHPFTFYSAGLEWLRKISECAHIDVYRSYVNRMVSAIWYTISMCKSDNVVDDELYCRLKSYMISDLRLNDISDGFIYDFVQPTYDKMQRYLSGTYQDHFMKKYGSIEAKIEKLPADTIGQKLAGKKVIASLTSYPLRIGYVAATIKTILNQTYKVDKVLLWLSRDQFECIDLPESLSSMQSDVFEIRWCDDLKPHKKYYYAISEYPDDVVITFDDDVEYEPDTVEILLNSFVHCPNAVSAMRIHKMAFENGSIAPYSKWIKEYDATPGIPDYSYVATGVGGVLYPPNCLDKMVFDKEFIVNNCLFADDLWLKIMELRAGTPVVLAAKHRHIDNIPGSQSTALWIRNVNDGDNDSQLSRILSSFPIDYSLFTSLPGQFQITSKKDDYADLLTSGTSEDLERAISMMRQKIEAGDRACLRQLCDSLWKVGTPDAYRMIIDYLEGINEIYAYKYLARIYHYGKGVECNYDQSVSNYEHVYNSGHYEIANEYADALISRGMPGDVDKAALILEQSFELGDYGSAGRLARMYRDGIGKERDLDKAIELMRISSDHLSWARDELVDLLLASKKTDSCQEALQILDKYCQLNDKNALFKMAQLYRNGVVVTKDVDRSIDLMKKAMNNGHNGAKVELAQIYLKQSCPDKAIGLLNEASKSGSARANLVLGRIYRDGTGVEKNLHTAADYFRRASSEGISWADSELMVVLWEIGDPDSTREMISIACRLEKQKNYRAIGILGRAYRDGRGVEKDPKKALTYLKAASENGISWAKKDYSALKDEMASSKKDNGTLETLWSTGRHKSLLILAKKQAESGDPIAKAYLGRLYRDGSSVEKDLDKAESLLLDSSENGIDWAQNELLELLWEKGDYGRAIDLAEKYLDAGNTGSAKILGRAYGTGTGVEKDPSKAEEYYRKASSVSEKT